MKNPLKLHRIVTRPDASDGPNAYSATILEALNIRAVFSGQHIYAGTVPEHVIKKRRAKDKAAKAARKLHRRNK